VRLRRTLSSSSIIAMVKFELGEELPGFVIRQITSFMTHAVRRGKFLYSLPVMERSRLFDTLGNYLKRLKTAPSNQRDRQKFI
jgi:hypothetical protein